ncbi:hypothetical protein BU17DRAFT_72705 [Hysterangium stoloniferum]|nr:hypothetical protein BU17DRAFT_72705 [Hysterangium stoloniferum]
MSVHEVVLSHPDQSSKVIVRIYFRDYGRVIERVTASVTTDQVTSMHRSPRTHLIHGFSNGLLDSSGIGQGMSDIEREAMTRLFAPVIHNPTYIELDPGYFCGLAMEWVGKKLLYGTKISILVGKCFFNTWNVEEHQWRVVRLTDTGKGKDKE